MRVAHATRDGAKCQASVQDTSRSDPRTFWLLPARGPRFALHSASDSALSENHSHRSQVVAISLKPARLRRYRDLAVLLVKYGRSDLVRQAGLQAALEPDLTHHTNDAAEPTAEAEELASDLERLGPAFVKLGQLLSTRADLLPAPYLQALARLQDRVAPFDFDEVSRIVQGELGVRISKAFSEFEHEPIAAASLAQVHRARLRDGRRVAVKVQRPGIREEVLGDLDTLSEIVDLLDKHTDTGRRYEFANLFEELRTSLSHELDYRLEANNLAALAKNIAEFPHVVVPSVVDDYTTSRVLTMEYISGRKITTLNPIVAVDVDGKELADELFRAYLKQMLVDGVFHADPHPGNVVLTDAHDIALLDLGMVGRLSDSFQEKFLRMLLAISEGMGEEAAKMAMGMGEPKRDFEKAAFVRNVEELVARHHQETMVRIEVGSIVLEITRLSAAHGFRLPTEFTLIAKALLNLDRVVYALDPAFDPNASIRRYASELLRMRLARDLSLPNVARGLLEVGSLTRGLPDRIDGILDVLASNSLKLDVDAIDEEILVTGMQKVANRIALGLILAALIVGAAMLMRVDTSFRILGYPGLAMLLFMVAAGGGIMLVADILMHDLGVRRRKHRAPALQHEGEGPRGDAADGHGYHVDSPGATQDSARPHARARRLCPRGTSPPPVPAGRSR